MELDWIEMVGFAGTGLTIMAYGARHLVPLRIMAISSSVAFLCYGLLTQSYPLVVMEVVLLPINICRLTQLLSERRGRPIRFGSRPKEIGDI